ncbi:MAG: ABC transporter substrate-binding protein, partial [Chloroflexota bacterium]|nr:ABC transporter substrate-binding protein [Chloroflexota bacterium]
MTRAEFHQAIRQRFPLERPVREGGLVIYGQTSDISVLNPMLVSDVLSARITSLVFDALVSVSPLDGLSAPGLADFWQRSDDGLRYTFHLNQNATWHDGRPVTADDVVFTYRAFLAEESPSGSKGTVATYLADVRKVDEHTVDLLAKDRSATFVEHTAGLVSILPRHIWESVPLTDWGRDPGTTGKDPRRVIGSGPFQFREWILNSHVTLDKRPDHWDPHLRPVIDTLMFRVLSASSAVLQAFEVGEIDIVDVETQEVAPLKQGRPDAEFTAFDTLNFGYFVTMQDPERTELFVDVPVRQALMYALDRQLLIDTVFDGYAVPATGTQPVPSIAYRPDQITTKYVHDPARARQLLEEAGWIVGNDGIRQRNGVRFSFECFFADSFPLFAQILPYMQQAWREVG